MFCAISGGFSFAADQFSNWLAGASTLCAVYLLAREFYIPRRYALLGAAMLGACPLFVVLSLSFMTDVPSLAATTWGMYAFVCAIRKTSDRWFIASIIFASLGMGIRLTGAVLPVAMLLVLVFHAGTWGRKWWRIALGFVPLVCLLVALVWHKHHTMVTADLSQVSNSPARRIEILKHETLPHLHRLIGASIIFTLPNAGCALLPLALASVRWRSEWMQRVIVCFAIAVVLGLCLKRMGEGPTMALSSGATWRIEELGATTDLAPGGAPAKPYSPALIHGLHYLFLAAGCVLVIQAFNRRLLPGEAVLRWMFAGSVLLVAVLMLLYDRYILPVLPILIVLALRAIPPPRLAVAWAGVVIFAAISMLGMRDHLAYNRALWQTVRDLHEQGVDPSRIDGGYVINGWFQYAHPEHAPRDASARIFVPWLTAGTEMPWTISNKPREGYMVISEHPVKRWIGPDVTIYVLRRSGA
jgi:4-amino-4-deoxy-L-arabinose transferase-like glycosyltransferase